MWRGCAFHFSLFRKALGGRCFYSNWHAIQRTQQCTACRDGVNDYVLLMALSCHANGNNTRGFIPFTATTSFRIQRYRSRSHRVSGRRFRTRASENTRRTAISSALELNSGALPPAETEEEPKLEITNAVANLLKICHQMSQTTQTVGSMWLSRFMVLNRSKVPTSIVLTVQLGEIYWQHDIKPRIPNCQDLILCFHNMVSTFTKHLISISF